MAQRETEYVMEESAFHKNVQQKSQHQDKITSGVAKLFPNLNTAETIWAECPGNVISAVTCVFKRLAYKSGLIKGAFFFFF